MYRIIFNPDTAKWQVQLLSYGLFWRTIKTNPIGFENWELASQYVSKVGLANVYRPYKGSVIGAIMSGDHPQNEEAVQAYRAQWSVPPAVIRSPRSHA